VRNNGWNQNNHGILVPHTKHKKGGYSASQFFNYFFFLLLLVAWISIFFFFSFTKLHLFSFIKYLLQKHKLSYIKLCSNHPLYEP